MQGCNRGIAAGISLLFYWILLTDNAVAQKFEAGFRAGMTASQVRGDQLEGFDKAGLLGGFYVSRGLTDRISLAMEMIYIQKGSRQPVNKEDNSYYVMRLNYIEVPLLFRIRAGKKIEFEAGPSFGVLVFSEEEDQLGEINYAPDFEKVEYSFYAGLSYLINDRWAVDTRYGFSLSPVRPFNEWEAYRYIDSGQFNALIQLSLNYQF